MKKIDLCNYNLILEKAGTDKYGCDNYKVVKNTDCDEYVGQVVDSEIAEELMVDCFMNGLLIIIVEAE